MSSIQLRAFYQDGSTSDYLDLNDDAIELDFSAKEVQDLTARRSPFSKTFTLPFTDRNNEFLEHHYNVNISTSYFNPNLKTDVVVSVGGITQIEGYMQLLEVNRTKQLYTVAVYGNVADLYSELKGKKLTDLDLSEFDHPIQDVFFSWQSAFFDPPGFGTFPTLSGATRDLLYPIADWGQGINNLTIKNPGIKSTDLRPSLRVKAIWDRIISDAGYTYDSNFIDSDLFDKLFFQLGTEGFTVDAGNVMKVGYNANKTLTASTVTLLEFDNEAGNNYDNQDLWNNANSFAFTAPVDSTYSFVLSLEFDTSANFQIGVRVNGNTVNTFSTGFTAKIFEGLTLTLSANDYVELDVFTTSAGVTIQANDESFFELRDSSNVVAGSAVYIQNILPDMSQQDFIKGFAERFNLIFDADPTDPKNLIIEPFNDYYDAGNIVDWTGKIDLSSDVIIKSTHEFQKRKLIYADARDKDRLNAYADENFDRSYGEFTFEPTTDFADGEEKTTPIFSPWIADSVDGQADILIGKMYRLNNGLPEPTETKPKFFYYAGVRGTGQTYTFDGLNLSEYPVCSMYEDYPIVPTDIDFHWGYVYPFAQPIIAPNGGTNRNMFNEYHRREVDEIYSDEARMLKARFILSPVDINTLRFNQKVFVEDTYYRINSIKGYIVGDKSECTVELIKVLVNNEFAGCEFKPDEQNPDGTVTFEDKDGVGTTDPGRRCCEAYGYKYTTLPNGTPECRWKLPSDASDQRRGNNFDTHTYVFGSENTVAPTARQSVVRANNGRIDGVKFTDTMGDAPRTENSYTRVISASDGA